MKINANKLMDYYAQASISFYDTRSDTVPAGYKVIGEGTNFESSGFIFPLSGSACFTLNGTPYVMTPGMVVHAGPRMKLNKEVLGNKTWSYALIHYKIPETQSSCSPYYHAHFNIPVGVNPRLMDMMRQLLVSDTTPGGIATLRSRSLFYHLIEEIVVSAKRQHQDNNGELIEDAVSFIHENYQQPVSIAELAKQYNLSNKHFIELFQKHTGITPVRYLTEMRIEQAKELMRTCKCSIKEIAECVGYSDNHYFSRAFKKQTGMAPSEFQERIKHNV